MLTQKCHSFSFYDRNKYKPLANDNPKQYLDPWIYDPNKYQKMWKHNPYLRHIPVYLYIGSDPPGFIHESKYLYSILTLLCYNHEAQNDLHHLSCKNRQNELKLTNTPSRVICFS